MLVLVRKTFSKFYRRHYELISKYNVGLKTLLSEGLSEPEFYGDLVYKFKKLIGSNDFSFQFRKIITRYRQKSTSRQRSGKGAIRKRLPLQKPRWEKNKLTIRHLYHENIS